MRASVVTTPCLTGIHKCFALGCKRSGSAQGFDGPFAASAKETCLGSSEVFLFGFSGDFINYGLGLGMVFLAFCLWWQVQVAFEKLHWLGRATKGRP